MYRLKKKTDYASPEQFVFAPNTLIEVPIKFDEIRIIGDEHFEEGRFKEAICKYTEAINSLEKMNQTDCARELAIFYEKRAAANERVDGLDASMADATKSIKVDEYYAKAYYRRGKGYILQEKFYCAMQDVLQACILEQFRNEEYNQIVAAIHEEIDGYSVKENADNAFKELNCVVRKCRHCIIGAMGTYIEAQMFDPLTTVIDENTPNTGYNRAISGVKNGNFDDLLAGCLEELANKTAVPTVNYNRCVIMRAFASCIYNQKRGDLTMETLDMITELIAILESPSDDADDLKISALLALAVLYDIRIGFQERVISLLDIVEDCEPNCLGVWVIRSGLFRETCPDPTNLQYRAAVRCCQLKPEFVDLQLVKLDYEHTLKIIPSYTGYLRAIEKLIEQFPDELRPRTCLFNKYQNMGRADKAVQLMDQSWVKFPDKREMLYTLKATLKPMDPSSVDLLKNAILANPNDTSAYTTLFTYYEEKTHEYAKALEVINRAYLYCNGKENLEQVYACRHKLLTKIVIQNVWHKL